VVEAGDALQQQVAQRLRELCALLACRGEKLFGEEGVTLRAGGDRVGHGRGQRSAGVSREQLRKLIAHERPELEHERGAGAPDAVGEPAHPRGRCGVVRPAGREQQDRPVAEVVREEDGQIEGRGIGPVQILEHEQHGCGRGAPGEQRQRLLEHPQLRAGRLPGG
jgi:hypothetical protein